MLAEREMTAVLQLLQDIAFHLKAKTTVTPTQLRDDADERHRWASPLYDRALYTEEIFLATSTSRSVTLPPRS